jgi:hypothetical protein
MKNYEQNVKKIGDYIITSQVIGKGMSGEIKLAKKDNEFFACKTISKEWMI